ncbi:LLM class flavin-dependent oxidoreductase [Candidatus Gracilibacteria bacterium]|nr:LLM class flavin-dependent oxidoreductase [Candidatus Gracilibacteria bacterium]
MRAAQFSVALQTDLALAAYGPLAAMIEGYGFDGVTVYNDLLYQPAWLPLLEIARHTRRVAIGPAAVNPFTCHPINIAGNIALIDEASQGRAYLGLARGAWLDYLGIAPARPVTALREALICVRRLLMRSTEPFSGEVFQLVGGDSLRWTILRPDLPFLLGSWGERAIRACYDQIAEIKLGGSANPTVVQTLRRQLAALAHEPGTTATACNAAARYTGPVRLAIGAVCVVDEDGAAARALARREAALYLPVIAAFDPTLPVDPVQLQRIQTAAAAYDFVSAARDISDELLQLVAFAGTPEHVVQQAADLIAAGADRVEFGTPHGLSKHQGLKLLGERVLPQLRQLCA